jgi:polar amino acid transport system substrate-binding protein
MELSYPPFEMTDPQGRPTGVSVKLAEALGRHLSRDVVIENIAFDGLIPALKTGKIDCIISSMTATPERSRSIAFSEPYLKTGLALLVGAKSPVKGADDLDVKGRTVAVKKGTTGHQFASSTFKQARLLVLDKEAAAVLEVTLARRDRQESKARIRAPKLQESRKVIGYVTAAEKRERGVAFDIRTDGGRSGDQPRG